MECSLIMPTQLKQRLFSFSHENYLKVMAIVKEKYNKFIESYIFKASITLILTVDTSYTEIIEACRIS